MPRFSRGRISTATSSVRSCAHAEQKACAHDLTDDVAVLMRPLENRGIVELSVGGKTELPPSTGEQLDNHRGSHRTTWPAGGQSALNGDAGEHCQLDSAPQN